MTTAARRGRATPEALGTSRTILVEGSATRGFTTSKRRHADDHQLVISKKPCLSTHPNQDENGSLADLIEATLEGFIGTATPRHCRPRDRAADPLSRRRRLEAPGRFAIAAMHAREQRGYDYQRGAGGRNLHIEITGPESGTPLIFHHGTPGSVHRFTGFQRAVQQHGLRLVRYSRAGCGQSSRLSGRTIADVVPDITAVLDCLGAPRCLVAGRSGGGPPALATAALLPERVAGALVIASFAPYDAAGLVFCPEWVS